MKRLLGILILVVFIFSLTPATLFARKDREFMEIESTSKPVYMKRKPSVWKKRTRLVGVLQNSPGKFTIEIYKAGSFTQKDLIATITVEDGMYVYESDWLASGNYDILIKAGIYVPYKVENIKLKANTDCRIDIVFGKEVYIES